LFNVGCQVLIIRTRPLNVFGPRPTKCSFYVHVCCSGQRPTRLFAHVSCWLFVFCSYCISIRVNITMTITCSPGRVDRLRARMQGASQPGLVPQTNQLRAYSLAWQTSRHPAGSGKDGTMGTAERPRSCFNQLCQLHNNRVGHLPAIPNEEEMVLRPNPCGPSFTTVTITTNFCINTGHEERGA
jgi:hypothetical protein